jgi:dynein heavy chain 2
MQLPFNTLMASAFITYLSDASEDVRIKFTDQWSNILELDSFDFCKFLGREGYFLNWQSYGLPADKLSRENAIMLIEVNTIDMIMKFVS